MSYATATLGKRWHPPGLAALCLFVFLSGCAKTEAPSAPTTSAPATLSGDEAVLHALDPYNPAWRLDEDGRVYHLKLEGKHIKELAVNEACKLAELNHLSLYGASIGDDALVKLQDLKKLESLGIGATLITDKGLAHLEQIHSLRYVWVSRDRVSVEKVEELKLKCPGLTVYLQ